MHARLVTWNFECSESIHDSRDGLARIGPGFEYGYGRSSRKELRCLTNVRTPCAAPSFVTSIKESYLKLKFNTPTVSLATVRADQAMAKDMSSGGGCAINAPRASLCALTHDEAW
jgi:hypothetical protein